jgi:hypothetical protein
MTRTLTNNELIMHRSRIYRGFRAPLAVTEFEGKAKIVSVTRDGDSHMTQLVQEITYPDGLTVTVTTDFTVDGDGNPNNSTVTYEYEDATPDTL